MFYSTEGDYENTMFNEIFDSFIEQEMPGLTELMCSGQKRKFKQVDLPEPAPEIDNFLVGSLSTLATESSKNTVSARMPVKLVSGSGSKHWTHRENVFLVGLVFDHLFERGTFYGNSTLSGGVSLGWKTFKEKFDTANARYLYLQGSNGIEIEYRTRTHFALQRHFRTMKAGIKKVKPSNGQKPLFRTLHDEWENKYNKNNILTCSDEEFSKHVERFEA